MKVYYNEKCSVCRFEIEHYKKQNNKDISWVDVTHHPNSTTIKKDTRARGRFINVKIENDDSGESWRFGTLRLDVQPDGRR